MKKGYFFVLSVSFLLLAGCAPSPKKDHGIVFYPAPPETPRVQFLTSISTETDLGKTSGFREYLLGETLSDKQITRPYGIAHDKGRIYVVDRGYKKVIIIDLVKKSFSNIRDARAGALKDPLGIAVTDDGYKYIADPGRGQIVVFNEHNEFVRAYGEEKQFRPMSVVVFENKIYVCDIAENEIEVLDKETGEVLTKIGQTGIGEADLYKPTHLAIDKDGNLYVTDALNFRIQMYDKNGKFIRSIGKIGTYPGTFGRPKGIDVDRGGHIYTADASFELIQIFDIESAEPLLPFGKYGPAPGSTYLPNGVHVDYDNVDAFTQYADPEFKLEYLIYVGNMLGNNKLNVYGFGEWTGTSFKNAYKPPVKEE